MPGDRRRGRRGQYGGPGHRGRGVWFEGNTGHRRSFTPAHLVAFSSDSETLHPGEVIGAGTVGLGCSMDLHQWPQVGQTFTVEVAGIGSLTHRIVPGDAVVDHVLNGMDGLLEMPPDLR